MTIAAAGSTPLPTSSPSDIVGQLNQLVSALGQLVQLLQARVSAGAGTTGGGPAAGVAQLDPSQGAADPKQAAAAAAAAPGGCGCGGASGALAGAAGAPATPQQLSDDAPATPPAAPSAPKPPAAPATNEKTVTGAAKHSKEENAKAIAKVATEYGVDPVVAVADALVESGLDNTEHTGDHGTSFGLYQLHENGELPKDWYPGKANHERAFDPEQNARIALARFRDLKGQYSGGELAYHAQRPADEAGYVKAVNGRMDEARKLLAS